MDESEANLVQCTLFYMCITIDKIFTCGDDHASLTPSFLLETYRTQQWMHPLESAMNAANQCSLGKLYRQYEYMEQSIVDMQRLLASVTSEPTRIRLQRQVLLINTLRTTSHEAPAHLQIARVQEDPLEARWDAHGFPVPLRRNVLGELYSSQKNPLQYMKSRTAIEIFQRMKHIVRQDLSTREQRRIAALNAKAKQRQQELEALNLTPEALLEAKLDQRFESKSKREKLQDDNEQDDSHMDTVA